MLDPKILVERRDEIAESCRNRGLDVDLDAILEAQKNHNVLVTQLGETNRLRNEHQKSGKRKLDAAEREAHVAEGRRFKEQVAEIEARLRESEAGLNLALSQLPNLVHPESPVGSEENFRVIKDAEAPKFDFEPLDHLQLCEQLDLVDFESAAKVAGSKWYYLKNEASLLDLALQRFALDVVMDEVTRHIVAPVPEQGAIQGVALKPATQSQNADGAQQRSIGQEPDTPRRE